jgi:hypothetical protein
MTTTAGDTLFAIWAVVSDTCPKARGKNVDRRQARAVRGSADPLAMMVDSLDVSPIVIPGGMVPPVSIQRAGGSCATRALEVLDSDHQLLNMLDYMAPRIARFLIES